MDVRAFTPVGSWYSTALFIGMRFIMGLMQCILCVYLPLWVHEFAPSSQRAKWMGALQSSVPFGVMIGYIIAAVLMGPVSSSDVCFHLLCWRWPLLFEWALLFPFCVAIHFVPTKHFAIHGRLADNDTVLDPDSVCKPETSYNTFPKPMMAMMSQHNVDMSKFKKMEIAMKAHSFATIESKVNRQQLTEEVEIPEVCDLNFVT